MNKISKSFCPIFVMFLMAGFGVFGTSIGHAMADSTLEENLVEQLASSEERLIYLPLVLRNHPVPVNGFGVEIFKGSVSSTIQKAVDLNITWVRYNGVLWHEAEPQKGIIDWSALTLAEAEIRTISDAGLEPMVVIRGTPTWARMEQYGEKDCGPIREDALDDFAAFVYQIVSLYSKPPYNVKYWEIGNEPDVDPRSYTTNYPFGCWGDNDDLLYFGGQYYAEMLKYVYPVIKAADPKAQVILGGLLLLCDPENPPNGDDCREGKFFEGILSNDGADHFDVLAYHAYPYWYDTMVNTDWDLEHPLWDHRGGTLVGKANFLREVMAEYGVNKPLLMNEGGMMCGWPDDRPDLYSKCKDGSLHNDQAGYAVRMYARTFALGVTGSAWYTLNGPGWREGGLLNGDSSTRPAYNSIKFIAKLLREAEYRGPLSTGTLEGYTFYDPLKNKKYRIYWSNDETIFPLNRMAKMISVYDIYGNDITPAGSTIYVGFEPIYVELTP